jgi:hypothetical protein
VRARMMRMMRMITRAKATKSQPLQLGHAP